MSVKVVNVSKYYSGQAALKNISFEIGSSEIVGFIGPNGAGKSTMMKIITGYIPPSEGGVTVNEINIVENPLEVKKLIGYLPENNPLYPNMYIREYLEFVAGLHKLGTKSKDMVSEIILKTGLRPEQHKKIGELSKGYRQRVGLAQALIHDPSILILDEPTSGLDPNQIEEIRELIKEVGKNKTVMLSTHIMQEVEAICERIIIINKGEIAADNKTSQIRTVYEKAITVIVEFNKELKENQLLSIDGVNNVAMLDNNSWLIETPVDIDIRERVFQFAVENKFAVLSMQRREKRLEEVFRELTKQ